MNKNILNSTQFLDNLKYSKPICLYIEFDKFLLANKKCVLDFLEKLPNAIKHVYLRIADNILPTRSVWNNIQKVLNTVKMEETKNVTIDIELDQYIEYIKKLKYDTITSSRNLERVVIRSYNPRLKHDAVNSYLFISGPSEPDIIWDVYVNKRLTINKMASIMKENLVMDGICFYETEPGFLVQSNYKPIFAYKEIMKNCFFKVVKLPTYLKSIYIDFDYIGLGDEAETRLGNKVYKCAFQKKDMVFTKTEITPQELLQSDYEQRLNIHFPLSKKEEKYYGMTNKTFDLNVKRINDKNKN